MPRLNSFAATVPAEYRREPDDDRVHHALIEIRAQLIPMDVQQIAIELDRMTAVLQCQTPATDALAFYYKILSRYPFDAVHEAADKLLATARFRILPTPAEFIDAIGKVPSYARLVRLEQRALHLAWMADLHDADAMTGAAMMALQRAKEPEEIKQAIAAAMTCLDGIERYEANTAALVAAIQTTLKKLPH